jgi:hypothetical protein
MVFGAWSLGLCCVVWFLPRGQRTMPKKITLMGCIPCDLGAGGGAGCWWRSWLPATSSLLMGSLGDPSSTLGVDANYTW